MSALKSEFRALRRKPIVSLKPHKSLLLRKSVRGKPSTKWFRQATLISPVLAAFLGKPEGTEMARTEVTREINGYIRQHKLQDKNNGRIIRPDAKLGSEHWCW